MKKAKKLGLQSLALVLMAFVLVAGVAFGMTGAWFTDGHKNQTAELTFGNVTAQITDSGLHTYRASDSTHTTATDTAVMPGDVLYGTLKIEKGAKSNKTSEDFWYKVEITVTGTGIGNDEKTAIEALKVDATKIDTTNADDTITFNIPLPGNAYGDSYENLSFQVTYIVKVIQAANIADATTAEAEFAKLTYSFNGSNEYTGTGTYTISNAG